MKKPQHIAWETMRFNRKVQELYGIKELTKKKIVDYIDKHNANDFISVILLLSNHSLDFIAKKTGKKVHEIKRFLPSAIQSVMMDSPQIGKKVVMPELIEFMNKNKVQIIKKVVGRPLGSKNKSLVKEQVIDETKTPFAKFKHKGKNDIHDNIERLLSSASSPKVGEIATLAGDLQFEYRLSQNPKLKDITYSSFEEGYSVSTEKISKVRFAQQESFLRYNRSFSDKVTLIKGNINSLVPKMRSETFAHLFLDYCNSFDTNEKAVKEVLANNIVKKGGIIWLTFSLRAGSKDIINRLPKLINQSGNYVAEKLKGENIKERLNGIYTYNHMYVIILRRVK